MIKLDRNFGEKALKQQSTFPQNVLNNFHAFLGKKYDSEAINKFLDKFLVSYDFVEKKPRGSVEVKIVYNKENLQLSMEEVYAMLFRYIKKTVEKYIGEEVKQCVVTVPNYFGYLEHLSIIQSIGLSELIVQLVSDNAAASVEFQQKKTFEKPENYIFYNIGSTSTQATLVTYSTKKIQNNTDYVENDITIRGEAWDQNLGEANFKYNLVKYLANKIDNEESRKDKAKISENREALSELLPYAENYLEILSSEKEASIDISEEKAGILFKGKLTREQFKEINKEEMKRAHVPIEQLLKNAGFNLSNITKIELIGNSIQIPAIQEVLKVYLGDMSSLLEIPNNSDTMVALGAARVCANYTTTYEGGKKPNIFLKHGVNYELKIHLQNLLNMNENRTKCNMNENQANVINESCYQKINENFTILSVRQGYDIHSTVSLGSDTDLSLFVYQQMEGENDEKAQILVSANFSGIDNMLVEMKKKNVTTLPKVNLKFHFNFRGLFSCSAEGIYEIVEYLGQMTGPTGETEVVFSTAYSDPLPKEEIEKIEQDLKNAASLNLTEDQQIILKKKREIGKKQVREEKMGLKIKVNFPQPLPLFGEDMESNLKLLEYLEIVDEDRELGKEKIKKLSFNIKAKKEWLDSKSSGKYGQESEIQETRKKLAEFSEWFEKEAEETDSETLEEKLKELNSYFSVYDNRKQIYKEREEAYEKFNTELKWAYGEGEKILKEMFWVKDHYNSAFVKNLQELEKWFNEMKEKQGSLKLNEDPIVTGDQIEAKVSSIKNEVSTLENIPMPKPVNDKIVNETIKSDL